MKRLLENQRKREEAMKEKELKRQQEEEAKKKKAQEALANLKISSTDSSQNDYETQQLLRRQQAAEKKRQEEEELKRRAQERAQKDASGTPNGVVTSTGESIQEDDFLEKAERERVQKERENDRKWRELDKTSTQRLNEKIKEHNASLEAQGGAKVTTKVELPSGVKEIPCICE